MYKSIIITLCGNKHLGLGKSLWRLTILKIIIILKAQTSFQANLKAYIDIGCIDIIMLINLIASDRFQYYTTIIICTMKINVLNTMYNTM